MDTRVISEIQERLERDHDASKHVLQSFGISKKPLHLRNFSSIFQLFPDTPVTMLKDVFEALQLYDLLELLESKSAIKPHRSLQLAYTLDEIKKLNGVADLPTTYHSCGAVLIITDDENVSTASAIKTFFTDLDNKSDVTEILTQGIPTLKHLNEEINAIILEISTRFGNTEGETQKQTVVPRFLFLTRLKVALNRLKRWIQQGRSEGEAEDVNVMRFMLRQLREGIDIVKIELNRIILRSQLEGKTELRQTDELKSFLQSTIVAAERIQENLTQLMIMQRSHVWFVIEEEKEKKIYQQNVSAVINRWIHRQG